MDKKIKKEMFEKALAVKKNAYVPYSKFPLAAAVLTKDGSIYTGVNIENASFSLTNCAERSAIFTAVSEGKKQIEALLIVSSTKEPASPCGACRQVIQEFANGDIEVIMMTESGKEQTRSSKELLPGAFSNSDLGKNNDI